MQNQVEETHTTIHRLIIEYLANIIECTYYDDDCKDHIVPTEVIYNISKDIIAALLGMMDLS